MRAGPSAQLWRCKLYFQCVIKQVEAVAFFFFIEKLEVAELFLHYTLHAVLLLMLEWEIGSHSAPTASLAIPTVLGAAEQGCRMNHQHGRISLLASLWREPIC